MTNDLDDLDAIATQFDRIRAEFATLKGSRDYQDRARRIALRTEHRELRCRLRDIGNDIKIGLMVDFARDRDAFEE